MKTNLLVAAVAVLTLLAGSELAQGQRTYLGAAHVKTFDFYGSCRGMAITSDDGVVWVSDSVNNRAHAIDLVNLTASGFKVASRDVSGIALNPDNSYLCVPGRRDDVLTLFRTDNGNVVWSRKMLGPHNVVIDGEGEFAYISGAPLPKHQTHHISVVSMEKGGLEAQIMLGPPSYQGYPDALALTEDERYLFAVESRTEKVTIVSTATWKIVKRIPLPKTSPGGIAIKDGVAYVCSLTLPKVIMIDVLSQAVSGEFPVKPASMAGSGIWISDEDYAFITCEQKPHVIVVDLLRNYEVVDLIQVGKEVPLPYDVVLTSDGNRMVVSDSYQGRVGVYDLTYVITASVQFRPQVFNLSRSTGLIGAQVTLPEEYNVQDVVMESVGLTKVDGKPLKQVIYALWVTPLANSNRILMFHFEVVDLFPQIEPGNRELTLEGEMKDGTLILGMGAVRALPR